MLAVAEQAPGELEEGVGAQRTRSPPRGTGRRAGRRGPKAAHEARRRPAEERREDGEGEAERDHDEDARPAGQAAVLDDDERRPVEQADGGDGARHVAEPRRAPARSRRAAPRGAARAPPRPRPRARTSGRRGRGARPRARPAPRAARPCSARAAPRAEDLVGVERGAHEDARVDGREPERAGLVLERARRPRASRSGATGSCSRVGRRYWPSVTMSTPARAQVARAPRRISSSVSPSPTMRPLFVACAGPHRASRPRARRGCRR